jgi:ribosomal protein S18 acetylase RimI-like enzyme
MNISFEYCDYENPVHLTSLVDLLNHYMTDPMGEATPLNSLQQLRLVDGLANHPSSLVLFVLSDGEIVGVATCFINFSTFNVKSYLYIHDIVVYADYRGKGFGKALMEKLIDLSTERDYCKLTLEVREDNFQAQGLYYSLGFEECTPTMLFWTKKL